MKNKKRLSILLLASLVSGSLISCSTKDGNSSVSPSNSEIETLGSYSLELNLKSVYSIGEIMDFSTSYIIKEESEKEVDRIPLLSNDVEIDGVDTNTEGEKKLTIKYLDFITHYDYKVITNYVTFKLNGGTINEKNDDIRVALNNNFLDLTTYRPIKINEDGTNSIFSGWFYDEDLTRRASYQLDTDFYSEESVTLYASYGYDYSSQFVYEINEKEHACSLLSINFDNIFDFLYLDELIIPKEIDGYPVTEIPQNIFNQYNPLFDEDDPYYNWASMLSIMKITFEEGSEVTTIGKEAFRGLTSLNEVVLPSNLQIIGDGAFSETGLSSVFIPKTVSKIGKEAFSYPVGSFSSITFEEGSQLKIIDEGAFKLCEHLSNITLPDGLEEIRDGAFELCNEIETIKIPASVSLLSSGTFKRMESLKSIEVDEGNIFYDSIDGHLYSKDKKKFIHYCFGNNASSFVIPSYVKSIDDNAFNVFTGYSSLMNLTLPDSLSYIGKNAFSGCSFALKLPKSLNSFALGAFSDYEGNKIEVDEGNTKYASKDGIIYSKDYTKLFACPTQIEIDDFVLDDRVKTISELAFTNVEGIKSFTIPETSNIEEIRKDGLLLPSFPNLAFFNYEPNRTPLFYESSFLERDFAYISNTYFVMIFKNNDIKEAFENILPNSEKPLPNYNFKFSFDMCTNDELISNIDSKLKDYGFTNYEYYLNSNHLYQFGNEFDINVLNGISNRIYAVYKLNIANEKQLGFLSLYEKYLYSSFLVNCIRKDKIDYLNLRHYQNLVHRYEIMPQIVKNAIKDTVDSIKSEFPFTVNFDNLHDLYEEIIDFPISENSFDKTAYKALNSKMEAAYLWRRKTPTSIFKKMIYLQISNAIDDVLNIKEYTEENVSYLYDILYKQISPEVPLGLVSSIDSYIKNDAKKKEIYHYDEFEQFIDEFNDPDDGIFVSYYHELKNDLNNFTFNPDKVKEAFDFYNDTCVQLLTHFYGNLQIDGDSEGVNYIEKIYTLSVEIDTANFALYYPSFTASNISDAKTFTNSIETVLNALCYFKGITYERGNPSSVGDELKESIQGFDKFITSYETLDEFITSYASSVTKKIENFELTKENLSSDSFLELYNEYSNLGSLSDSYLSYETVERYNLIYASYLVNYVLDRFTAIDETNVIDFKIFYFGYFDFNSLKDIEGISSYINDAIFNVTDPSSILNYDQYLTIINSMMEA